MHGACAQPEKESLKGCNKPGATSRLICTTSLLLLFVANKLPSYECLAWWHAPEGETELSTDDCSSVGRTDVINCRHVHTAQYSKAQHDGHMAMSVGTAETQWCVRSCSLEGDVLALLRWHVGSCVECVCMCVHVLLAPDTHRSAHQPDQADLGPAQTRHTAGCACCWLAGCVGRR